MSSYHSPLDSVNPDDQRNHSASDFDPLIPLAAYDHGWSGFHTAVARALGSVNAAILLHKMYKWSQIKTAKRRDGRFYASRDQITKETGLSRCQQETARKILVKHRVVEENLGGIPCRIWYLVNLQAVHDLLAAQADKDGASRPKPRQSVGGKTPHKRENIPLTSEGDVRQQGGGDAPSQSAGMYPTYDSLSTSDSAFESHSTPFSLSAAGTSGEPSGMGKRNGFLPLAVEQEAEVKRMVADLAGITGDSRNQEQVETLAARAGREGRRQTWEDVRALVERKAVDRPNSYFCTILETRLDKPAPPPRHDPPPGSLAIGSWRQRGGVPPVPMGVDIDVARADFNGLPQHEQNAIVEAGKGEARRRHRDLNTWPISKADECLRHYIMLEFLRRSDDTVDDVQEEEAPVSEDQDDPPDDIFSDH